MARPQFTTEFEESENVIKDRMLDRISDEWRKQPGDFIYDSIAPTPLEIKQLQINQDQILKNAFAQYAEGSFLDAKLKEEGLTRKAATPNQRTIAVTASAGVQIPEGHTLTQVVLDDGGNPLEFTTDQLTIFEVAETKNIPITCTESGTIGNLTTGADFILQPTIPGIKTTVDQGSNILGTDTETDEEAWERYFFKVSSPDTGGNINDYIRWTDEVTGVGKIKVIPRWNGNGTVKVIITDIEGQPATVALVEEVQEYLDPSSQGLGEGKAPCGARVSIISATTLSIDIDANVIYESGVDQAVVKENFIKKVNEYFFDIIFTGQAVSYNKIGAYLVTTEGIANYSALTLNAGTTDIVVGSEKVAILGAVVV